MDAADAEAAGRTHLERSDSGAADSYPAELSGGQKQRVASLAHSRSTRNYCCSTSRPARSTPNSLARSLR